MRPSYPRSGIPSPTQSPGDPRAAARGSHAAAVSLPRTRIRSRRGCSRVRAGCWRTATAALSPRRPVRGPYVLYARSAQGARVTDADGHELIDFNNNNTALIPRARAPRDRRGGLEADREGQRLQLRQRGGVAPRRAAAGARAELRAPALLQLRHGGRDDGDPHRPRLHRPPEDRGRSRAPTTAPTTTRRSRTGPAPMSGASPIPCPCPTPSACRRACSTTRS